MTFHAIIARLILVGLPLLSTQLYAQPSKEITQPIANDSDATLREQLERLPVVDEEASTASTDYLIDPSPYQAQVVRSADGRELILENGLVRRAWRLSPNGACVAYDNLMTGQAMLRSVRPEARVTVNGQEYNVGGLTGQPNHAYLSPKWLDSMQADKLAMRLVGFEVGKPKPRLGWKKVRHVGAGSVWPPSGSYLRMDYHLPSNATIEGLQVSVHYELYDGIPVMSKWVSVDNKSKRPITVERFTGEELALVEHSNPVETRTGAPLPRPDYLHVETDFAFGGFHSSPANRHVVHWRTDPTYTTQVNYLLKTPCLLVCEPTYGPAQRILPNGRFDGFRVFELTYDDGNRERRSMAYRRMYRTIAPWVTENPITHHLLTNKPRLAREAIDKAAEVGFEAIIFSFGSGFNMENQNLEFLNTWKEVASYAQQKGVELGSYSLLSSRGVSKEHMLVPPKGQTATHGRMPALTSEWGQNWIETVREFYRTTGFSQFENDGPYPGDVDVTPRPPLQHGMEDSRWAQWQQNNRLYHGLRAAGVYINQPDYHYLNGGNKSSMGYREVNWSLPRAQQVIHTRQNIYDGTWLKTPSMGWMHVPLSQYHGGGAAATIEPLHEHIDHYRLMMLSNLGMGVQAHYRGPRIYDTDETRDMVKFVVDWFKQYRDILESDIVHGRRADGRDLDWILHANPQLKNKGMLCVYNPLDQEVSRTLRVNVYYTGISGHTEVRAADKQSVVHRVGSDNSVELKVTVPANGMTWYLLRAANAELINFQDEQSIKARRPIIIAHRGGVVSPKSAECSLSAIRLAAEMGYDMVELDVRRSQDGVPIVFHDHDLSKACGKHGTVSQKTAKELKSISYRKGNDPIASLNTALQACQQHGLGVMLDLKEGKDQPDFLKQIDHLIVEHGLENSTISITSSDTARVNLPHVRFTPTNEEMHQLRAGLDPDLSQRFWFGLPKRLQPGDVKRLKTAKALVLPAINTFRYPSKGHYAMAKDDIQSLTDAGVDGFQIDSVYFPLFQQDE